MGLARINKPYIIKLSIDLKGGIIERTNHSFFTIKSLVEKFVQPYQD